MFSSPPVTGMANDGKQAIPLGANTFVPEYPMSIAMPHTPSTAGFFLLIKSVFVLKLCVFKIAPPCDGFQFLLEPIFLFTAFAWQACFCLADFLFFQFCRILHNRPHLVDQGFFPKHSPIL